MPVQFCNLSGKTAIITGASRGIGKAIAQGLYKQGCNLALISRNEINVERKIIKVEK